MVMRFISMLRRMAECVRLHENEQRCQKGQIEGPMAMKAHGYAVTFSK
jgi:hypothetical protein